MPRTYQLKEDRQRPLFPVERGAERVAKKPRRGMTAAQTALYWREWAAARRVFIARGLATHEADEMRYELTDGALGQHVSSKHFSNAQFDLVLGAFRAVSRGDDLGAQMDAESGPRRRLVYGLLKLAEGREAYVEEICQDCYGHGDWRRLPDEELTKLRATLARRVERRRDGGTEGWRDGGTERGRDGGMESMAGECDGCGEQSGSLVEASGGDGSGIAGVMVCPGCKKWMGEKQAAGEPF